MGVFARSTIFVDIADGQRLELKIIKVRMQKGFMCDSELCRALSHAHARLQAPEAGLPVVVANKTRNSRQDELCVDRRLLPPK